MSSISHPSAMLLLTSAKHRRWVLLVLYSTLFHCDQTHFTDTSCFNCGKWYREERGSPLKRSQLWIISHLKLYHERKKKSAKPVIQKNLPFTALGLTLTCFKVKLLRLNVRRVPPFLHSVCFYGRRTWNQRRYSQYFWFQLSTGSVKIPGLAPVMV